MTTEQPLALRLADDTQRLVEKLRRTPTPLSEVIPHIQKQADELRRQHAEIAKLREALRKAVNRQGFSNAELISARAVLAQGEKT
jgi:prefoldin subunit 5